MIQSPLPVSKKQKATYKLEITHLSRIIFNPLSIFRTSRISCISGGKRNPEDVRSKRDGNTRGERERVREKGGKGTVIRAQERNASAVGHSPVTEGATPPIQGLPAERRSVPSRSPPEETGNSSPLDRTGGKIGSFSRSFQIESLRPIKFDRNPPENRVKIVDAREFILRKDT